MIMTQVLTSLLQGDFKSLNDLPTNVRNDALLDLAKLAGDGKLSGKIDFILINCFQLTKSFLSS